MLQWIASSHFSPAGLRAFSPGHPLWENPVDVFFIRLGPSRTVVGVDRH